MLKLFLDLMPKRLANRNVALMVLPPPLLPHERTREFGWGQSCHELLDLGLNVRLIFLQHVDRRRSIGVALLGREREGRAALHPEVESALRVREYVEEAGVRRTAVLRQLRWGKFRKGLEVAAAGVSQVREPCPKRLHL